MIEILKIKLFGIQPVPKITKSVLDKIIKREFNENRSEVSEKLEKLKFETKKEKARISVAILKLSNRNINEVKNLIEVANVDFRNIISQAQYPRCTKLGFELLENPKESKRIYLEDLKEYSDWLKKIKSISKSKYHSPNPIFQL